ncbi:MAG: relaxase/mobilization nuclease domain-containing protein [Acutalibacteraceae bacterium]
MSSYECDPATVAAEFLLAKASYKAMTGREQKQGKDVLCYQIRQSFYPGEITPEEANRVSYELAMRWTKGRHAFIVTTHTDKEHIHCIFTTTPQPLTVPGSSATSGAPSFASAAAL